MSQILQDILGVGPMAKTDKYLGNQLLLPTTRISSFDGLLERCKLKLSSWKSHTLSHAGKTILLKSSLASIPIYSMGTSMLPKGVIQQITQIQRNFWWGSSQDHRKICHISWEKITKPKQAGGLGVRKLDLVNLSLISKLVWRFLVQSESVWAKLLMAKYSRVSCFWEASLKANSSTLWKSMIQCRDLMKDGIYWLVAKGENIHIWNDPWIPTIPGFKAVRRHDSLHQVSRVAELFLPNSTQWDSTLIHHLFEPYVALVVLRIQPMSSDGEDKLVWLPSKTGEFTAKSMYMHLLNRQPSGSQVPVHLQDFKWSKLWNIRGVAPRIILFLWRAIHNGLAVGKKLRNLFGGSGLCTGCHGNVETVEHSLFLCPRAAAVWNILGLDLSWLNNTTTLAKVITIWFRMDIDVLRRGCVILWAIWKARNRWVFTTTATAPEEILRSADILFQEYKLPPDPHLDILPPGQLSNHSSIWQLPPPNVIKINFDGACINGELAAVARDSNGTFLGGITRANTFGSPIQAEAQGCILAIDLINRLNLSQVMIEGDSKTLIDS